MQTRYYNPETGRFLNADALAATGTGVLGNNMFVYCNNAPVSYADPIGLCTYVGNHPWLGLTMQYIDCGRIDCPQSSNYFPITASVSVSGSVTVGPNVYGGQLAFVTDSYGFSEIQFTYYSALSSTALADVPSVDTMIAQVAAYEKAKDILEFSLMGNMSFYNAPSVDDLYNEGYQLGGTIGSKYGVAVDYNIIPNGSNTPYTGVTLSAGLGSTDAHAVMGTTSRLITSKVSVYDLAEAAFNGLWGIH